MLGDDDRADVVGRSQQPDAANQILLFPLFEVIASGVRVAAAERGEHLRQSHAVCAHARRVDVHLILLDEAAAADDVRDARRHLQVAFDHPVLDPAKIGWRRGLRHEAVAIQLADRRRERRELRLDLGRQVRLRQPLEDALPQAALPREVVVDLVVEGDRQKR